ncbi:MAG TPA: AAA family ATPase [Bacteroidales bacterium]|nr:ATP-dependent endonuclease [Bacteroidales bacterium]HRC88575.1 AAA family ATPase [Bacteroidales bacterium]
MRDTLIYNHLIKFLDNVPTDDQAIALKKIASFLINKEENPVFLLTGYAGTGKTTLISAVVKTLDLLRMRSVLLAPTGRAAKVLSSFTGRQAYTIHKKIYRQKSLKDGTGKFELDRNLHKNTVFIVDEASMVSNKSTELSIFGSGKLLEDLIEYVYTGEDCRLMLVGDTAQLPPVGSVVSPALDNAIIEDFGFKVESAELKQVLRQSLTSGILVNATRIREQITAGDLSRPSIDCHNFRDIIRLSGNDFLEEVSAAYEKCGLGGTIIVVYSNKQANIYNSGIRSRIFFREEEIEPGDIVMVVKNNYSLADEEDPYRFIANGDIAEVLRVRNYEERYGFRFAEMSLRFPDYGTEIETKVMLDVLHLDYPALPADKNTELFKALQQNYAHIKIKKKQYDMIREDPYFNALQIKFAYAVTCHKAQGGQWERVFIDQGLFNRADASIDYLRWLYTALTRSTDRVYLVNFPEEFFNEG